jgi:hypothetical protein
MTMWEIVEQAFHFAVRARRLWLFGFFVGLWSGGSSGGGAGGGNGAAASAVASAPIQLPFHLLAILAVAGLALLLLLLRFIGEGALIEGVVRAREGATMGTRAGLRAGWAHWAVLLRIALLYFGATTLSVAVPVAAVVAVTRTAGLGSGAMLALLLAIPVVPWLVTLYLLQAFGMRIAVLEHRNALDALAKARLFLHGRLVLGLKLLVATFIGTLVCAAVAVLTMAPVALLLLALLRVTPVVVVIAVGSVVLLPLVCVLTAMLGTYRSSVWTLGYVSQVRA